MAENTDRFGLLKKDPVAEGTDTFNIKTMLNDNWDKLDGAAKKTELDDAVVDVKNYTDTAIEEAIGGIDVEVPVTSVNGKEGDVNLTAEDVGAETPQGAQQKVDILAGEGNTKTVKEIDDSLATLSTETANEFLRQATEINRLTRTITSRDREIAYLKLMQDAEDRLEDRRGTVFAEDMNGNRIGMTLDEINSHNIAIRDGKLILVSETEVEHDVQDATVVNEAYSTEGNGGRKLVRLENGWLVAGVWDGSSKQIKFYATEDNDQAWSQLCYISQASLGGFSLVSKATMVYIVSTATSATVSYFFKFDAVTVTNTSLTVTAIDSGQSTFGDCSLAINREGTELHAAWSSKNSTYPDSFNIRYAKGIINSDGSVTWGAVGQVTKYNDGDVRSPSLIVRHDGIPVILMEARNSYIHFNYRVDGSWLTLNQGRGGIVYSGGTYAQSSPSAIFVPPEINGLPQGRIWVTWLGRDSSMPTSPNVRVSYSDDGGVTWSSAEKLTNNDVNKSSPSITFDKNNKGYIVYQNYLPVSMLVYDNSEWSQPENIISGDAQNGKGVSTLIDFSIGMHTPLFIFGDSVNSKVSFYGKWTEIEETPELTATAVYDLPSTDYVGAFVQKMGNLNIEAYINDQLMDDDGLENDEYMFTKALDSEVPVKLRLELSRDDTSDGENDCVTRILGGIA